MPERESFLDGLRACYEDYRDRVEELERGRKPGEGIFGMRGGPKDDPCHERFAQELRERFAAFAAESPSSGEVRRVLDFVYTEPLRRPAPASGIWMLHAVQGLIDFLVSLELEGDGDDTDSQYACILGTLSNDRCCAGSRSATHSGGNEDHSGSVIEHRLDVLDAFLCCQTGFFRTVSCTKPVLAQL